MNEVAIFLWVVLERFANFFVLIDLLFHPECFQNEQVEAWIKFAKMSQFLIQSLQFLQLCTYRGHLKHLPLLNILWSI